MSFVLGKEFSLADQLRGAVQIDFAVLPSHDLSAPGRMHLHRRPGVAGGNRGHGRSARSCARRLRLTHAALIKSHFNIMLACNADKLHVYALFEVLVAANLLSFSLPSRREVCYKHHV